MFKNIANMDTFLKEDGLLVEVEPEQEVILESQTPQVKKSGKKIGLGFLIVTALLAFVGGVVYKKTTSIDTSYSLLSGVFSENVLNEVVPEASVISAASNKREIISVPQKLKKADPFLPYRDISLTNDLPPVFELLEPPETAGEYSQAGQIMDTSVSGILYDAYSPSAILNIEGVDQLVKKGDKISNYEILEIERDSVTVKLGANIYRAGIGEMLVDGRINHNKISNLDTKFGGKNGNE